MAIWWRSLIQKRPVAYQIASDGSRRSIQSSYRKNADGTYGFQLGSYDRSRPLVIDPVLIVAQYFAGSYSDIAYGIGHDSKGRVYIGGTTLSTDLPLVGSSFQTAEGGGIDLFLAVVNPALPASSQVIYVTYIGGTEDETFGGMTVGPNGDVYMTGTTASGNFPVANAAQTAIGGSNGCAGRLCPLDESTQTLNIQLYSVAARRTAARQSPWIRTIWIWVVGNTQSTDLPNTGGFQGSLIGAQNMFVAGFDPSQSGTATHNLFHLHRGTHWDEAYGIALAPDGTIWLAGGTYSPDIWIQGQSLSGAIWRRRRCLYGSYQSGIGRARLCCTRASWAATESTKPPAWCWIRPANHRQRVHAVVEFSRDQQRVSNQIRWRHRCFRHACWTRQNGSWFIPLTSAALIPTRRWI